MVRRLVLLAAAAFRVWPTPSGAQELLTASDVVAMEAPAPDRRIAYGEGGLNFGHLRLPEGADGPGAAPHPVVVFIHGGCWLSEYGIGHVGLAEEALAEAGYAVWSLEYRRVGDEGGGWPGTFRDVAAGVDHLRRLAREYPLDLDRVVAVGHSAGGQLALWAAARSKMPPGSPIHAPAPLPVRGVVGLAPAATLAELHRVGICGDVVDGLMGGGPDEVPDRYRAASPMRLTPVGVPQRVIVGVHDETWGPHGRAYVRRAREAGEPSISLRVAPESGHFEMIVPGTSTWLLVLEELDALFREIEEGAPSRRERGGTRGR